MTLLLSKEQIEAIQARADDAHTYWFKVTEFHKHARTDIPALCQQALRAIELEAAMEEMRGQRHKLGARIVGLQTELTAARNALEEERERCAKLERELAECRVLAIRGSYDAPGFDACVMAELKSIRALPSPQVKP